MNSSYTVEAQLKATGVSKFQQAFANAEQSMKGLKEVGTKVGDIGKTLTKSVTLPVMALGTGVVAVGKQYEESMSEVAAISGATGKDLDQLKDTAREMGATTRYSASESADALGFMALAGWDVEQMTSALPGVLDLATAGSLDLAKASDIVTDTMSMFGMEAKDAGKASDIFAAAQSKSNTNVEQLSEALLNAGPAASAAGADLEQTSAILGVFANQGVKGGRAGTALNAMFRDLKASTKDGAVAIGEAQVAVYDASGEMRAMGDIMADVESATEGMTGAQRDAALADVFKQQSLAGVNLLLNEGSDALKTLETDIYNSEGAASEMAEIMDNNLGGALANMKSALEEVALGFYDMASGPITALIQKITSLLQWFGNLSDSTKQWIIVLATLGAAIGPLLLIIAKLITAAGTVTKAFLVMKPIIIAAGTAIAGLSAPVLIAIGVITSLIAIGVALYKNWDTVKAKAGQLKSSVVSQFNGLKDGAVNAFNTLKSRISSIISSVTTTIKSIGNINLFSAGKAIIDGFIGGLKSTWEKGKSFIGGIGGWIKRNKGPISYDRRLLKPAGNAIIGGLNKGLEKSFPQVQSTVRGMAGAIQDSFNSNPSLDINGNIARSNAQVHSAVSHEINRKQSTTQPAYINVNIGGQNFRGFVENISNEQGRITDLELQF